MPTLRWRGGTSTPQELYINTYDLLFNATKISPFGWSKHTCRFGGDIRREEAKRLTHGEQEARYLKEPRDPDDQGSANRHNRSKNLSAANGSEPGSSHGPSSHSRIERKRHDQHGQHQQDCRPAFRYRQQSCQMIAEKHYSELNEDGGGNR